MRGAAAQGRSHDGQPAHSELEKDLAIKLFERKPTASCSPRTDIVCLRSRKKWRCSPVGGETIKSAQQASGRVRLATMEGIASYYLTEKLVDFNAQHPEILVELVTNDI